LLRPRWATVADAIASAPRSPFLDDLAIAHAARAYIETIRIIRSNPHALGRQATPLLGCVGQQRLRFERELSRLAQIRFRALVIEASFRELAAGTRFSQLTSRQVLGSVLAWTFKYSVAPIFAGDRHGAAIVTKTLLSHAARYAQPERKTP
jgi:hypothetical protein